MNPSRQQSFTGFSQPQQMDETFDGTTTPLFSSGEDYPGNFTDISAMMFPSGDPFAYPNQPMLAFENANNPTLGGGMNTSMSGMAANTNGNHRYGFGNLNSHDGRPASISLQSNADAFSQNPQDSAADDIQLFGTMPMYLIPPNRGNNAAGAFVNRSRNNAQMPNVNPQKQQIPSPSQPVRQQGFQEGELNANDMFASGDEWAGTFMEQGFGFGFGNGAEGMNGVSFR
jgi:hypothetical protein